MIILYTSPGCASCRKAKQWLKDNDMKYIEKNIFTTLLKEDEIKYLLQRTENGTEDILSLIHISFVVKNPGIKYTVPFVRYFVEHKVKILTEVEIGYRYATKFKYGAVTGTNGKTTITTMLYEMLKYNHKAIAVSYTHLDVYKRQSWHQYTPQCFHSIQLRFLRYPLHARVYGR